jgi:hypothetical protein
MKKEQELQLISNIEKEYRGAWRIAMISLIGFVLLGLAGIWGYTQLSQSLIQNKMVVVADRLGNEYLPDRKAQLIGHLTNFHSLFFRIDEFNFKKSIEKSFHYIDNQVGRRLRDHYTANEWYKNIQQYNLSIGIEADSIVFASFDSRKDVYHMIYYGKQYIRSKNEILVRNLITKSVLKSVENTIDNPFGAMITDFSIIDNRDIERRDLQGSVLKSLNE